MEKTQVLAVSIHCVLHFEKKKTCSANYFQILEHKGTEKQGLHKSKPRHHHQSFAWKFSHTQQLYICRRISALFTKSLVNTQNVGVESFYYTIFSTFCRCLNFGMHPKALACTMDHNSSFFFRFSLNRKQKLFACLRRQLSSYWGVMSLHSNSCCFMGAMPVVQFTFVHYLC